MSLALISGAGATFVVLTRLARGSGLMIGQCLIKPKRKWKDQQPWVSLPGKK